MVRKKVRVNISSRRQQHGRLKAVFYSDNNIMAPQNKEARKVNFKIKKSHLNTTVCLLAVSAVLLNTSAVFAAAVIDPNIWKFGSFEGQSNVSITVSDTNGVQVTFSLTGGWGQIDGNDSSFEQINLYGTTETSIFSIKTVSGQQTSIGNITAEGSLSGISAKTADLRGNITITGSVGKIELDDIDSNHLITIGASINPKAGVLLKFDEVNDLTIDSNTPIKVLMCTQWLDNDANEDRIIAPSLGTLQVRGDTKRGIPGDFEASLLLDGSNQLQATLVNAKIKGAVSNHTWDITGDARTLQAGGWFNGNLIVDGNVASLRLNQLHGNLDIAGNARSVSIAEPMAIRPPDSGEIGRIDVAGTASVRGARNVIRFTDDTLYTSEPNMYRLEDLRRYDVLGAYWDYTSTYSIIGGGLSQSGTEDTSISVQPALQNINGYDSYIIDSCAFGTCLSMGWYTDSGVTHLAAWISDELTLWMDIGVVEQEFLRLGELYEASGSFGGTLTIDSGSGTINGTFTNGEISTTYKLVGHEQVTVPAGTFMAAKVVETIAMAGNMQIDYSGYTFTGSFTAKGKETWWGVPEVGIVKTVTNLSEKISISGAGSASVTTATIDELTDYGL